MMQPETPKPRRRGFMSIIGIVLILFVLIDSGSGLIRGDLGVDNRNLWLFIVAVALLILRLAMFALVPWLRIRREQAESQSRDA